MSRKQDLEWSFGLRNSAGKYLTSETFGGRLNCAASTMKKKQIWFLEHIPETEAVYFKNSKGDYLSVDRDGKLHCNSQTAGDEEAFVIEAQSDGRWAIKSNKYGWFAGGAGENLTAFTKEISEDRLWTVRLAMHPTVTIRNVQRKAFMHLSDSGDSLDTDEIIPWGHDASLNITFFESGLYGIQASNGKFLVNSGALTDTPSEDSEFILEILGGLVSFRSKTNNKYLTALGAGGVLKASKSGITKDEGWQLQNSYPQITLKSNNGKFLSIHQGIEVAASRKTANSDEEIWQLEPLGNGKWTVKGTTDKLWALKDDMIHCVTDPIVGSEDDVDKEEHFIIEFLGGNIAMKASNGKYLSQLNNGYIKASAAAASDDEKSLFEFTIVNRPVIALRGDFGFVNTMPSGLLECNKSKAEMYQLETKNGLVAISTMKGKYWKVGENGISASGDAPEYYSVELFQNSKLVLKHDGKAFQGVQYGAYTASSTGSADKSTLFEY